ncbi:glycerophosphodiester phosphodiesterase family protein [Knoellia subterranea]|uniref:Glycerophosphoryl diester phosphodiesterase n=1 Tax=Knoellia subterranea KCTC 19937 TaxID=1385521 RepID=A0A0A0JR22_9MICO|nr:glycerophosphodiester phosphodiesterase family protein [Knoellia subterranea]KGN39184.1 glycerophosphoryl diester phosphodiesterase [Knoellia subterranea KCTC 19937]
MARAADFAYFDHVGPIAMAHRGGAAYGPNVGLENTMGAFRRAVELGYRYLETDVHATADGELVAFHDTRLDRVTDVEGAIVDLPYAAVREARINGTDPVPLLTELLEEFPTTRLNIDIKADSALEPTVETIRRHHAIDRVCIGSFSERRVRAARKALGPRLATAAGQVGTGALRFAPGPLSRALHTPAPVLQIPAVHRLRGREITLVTPQLVSVAHRLGKQVHVWFHEWSDESAREMHRLLDLGVDGIVTDHIATLREVLAERGHPLRPPT